MAKKKAEATPWRAPAAAPAPRKTPADAPTPKRELAPGFHLKNDLDRDVQFMCAGHYYTLKKKSTTLMANRGVALKGLRDLRPIGITLLNATDAKEKR